MEYDRRAVARSLRRFLEREGIAAPEPEAAAPDVLEVEVGKQWLKGIPGLLAAYVRTEDLHLVQLVRNGAALRAVLGEPTFHRAFVEYGRRWIGRHPQPYDFFNTMAEVSGRDLSWFWQTWFYHAWSLDQAIARVAPEGDSLAITIEDRGLAPMPVRLVVTRADGSAQRVNIPVDVWLAGARRTVVRVVAQPAVTGVEIDPEHAFPDLDRTNQVWRAPGVGAGTGTGTQGGRRR